MLYIIAVIKESLDTQQIKGFTLYNSDDKQYMNFEYDKIRQFLLNGNTIENVKLRGKNIVGVNGALDRYAVINEQGKLLSKPSVTVIGVMSGDNKQYYVVAYNGIQKQLSHDDLIKLSNTAQLANAKIVKRGYKYYIGSISGAFPLVFSDGSTVGTNHNSDKLFRVPNIRESKKYNSFYLEEDNGITSIVQNPCLNISHIDKSILDDEIADKLWIKSINKKEGISVTRYNPNLMKAHFVFKVPMNNTKYRFGAYCVGNAFYTLDTDENGARIVLSVTEATIKIQEEPESDYFIINISSFYDRDGALSYSKSSVNHNSILVKDILYMGSDYKLLGDDNLTGEGKDYPNCFIAIGRIGLILVFNYLCDEEIDDDIATICIPYCKIKTLDALRYELLIRGINVEQLGDKIANKILKEAQMSTISIKNVNGLADLVTVPSKKLKFDRDRYKFLVDAIQYNVCNCADIKHEPPVGIGYFPKTTRKFNDSTMVELAYSMGLSDIYRVNNCDSVIINRPQLCVDTPDGIHWRGTLEDNNGNITVTSSKITIQYIAYIILAKVGTLQKQNVIDLVGNEICLFINNLILLYSINDDNITVLFGDKLLKFDIGQVIARFNTDIASLDTRLKLYKLLESKCGILGHRIAVDRDGMITKWSNGVRVDATAYNIRGIRVSNSYIYKKITLFNVSGDIEISASLNTISIDSSGYTGIGQVINGDDTTRLKQLLAGEKLFKVYKDNYTFNYEINLPGIDPSILEKLIYCAMISNLTNDELLIGNEKVKLTLSSFYGGLEFIIQNANTVISKNRKRDGVRISNSLIVNGRLVGNIEFSGQEHLEIETKQQILSKCLNSIFRTPKGGVIKLSSQNYRSIALKTGIVKAIASAILTQQELNELDSKLERMIKIK